MYCTTSDPYMSDFEVYISCWRGQLTILSSRSYERVVKCGSDKPVQPFTGETESMECSPAMRILLLPISFGSVVPGSLSRSRIKAQYTEI